MPTAPKASAQARLPNDGSLVPGAGKPSAASANAVPPGPGTKGYEGPLFAAMPGRGIAARPSPLQPPGSSNAPHARATICATASSADARIRVPFSTRNSAQHTYAVRLLASLNGWVRARPWA